MPLNWTGPRQFSIDPKSPDCYRNPYAIYEALQAIQGPCYWQNYKMWCVSEFDQVDKILKSSQFARLPSTGESPAYPPHLNHFATVERFSLLALEAPEHTRLRRKLNRSFVVRELDKLVPMIEQTANNCIDRLLQHKNAELLQDYATPIPVRVIAGMLGVPIEESQQLLDWSHAMVKVYTMQQSLEDEHAANIAAREFNDRLMELIVAKRSTPSNDMLSSWIHEHELNNEELVSLAVLLLNAGHEASVHQMGNAIKLLLEHPEHQRYLLQSDQHADDIVTEIMRFDPPLHLFTRYAQNDIAIGGDITLKKDEQVALLLAAANRDPNRFTKANQFIPQRTDGAHLSLGSGSHFCLGAYLAKLELRIGLQVLFSSLPDLTLTAPVEYKDSYHFHGLEKLEVHW